MLVVKPKEHTHENYILIGTFCDDICEDPGRVEIITQNNTAWLSMIDPKLKTKTTKQKESLFSSDDEMNRPSRRRPSRGRGRGRQKRRGRYQNQDRFWYVKKEIFFKITINYNIITQTPSTSILLNPIYIYYHYLYLYYPGNYFLILKYFYFFKTSIQPTHHYNPYLPLPTNSKTNDSSPPYFYIHLYGRDQGQVKGMSYGLCDAPVTRLKDLKLFLFVYQMTVKHLICLFCFCKKFLCCLICEYSFFHSSSILIDTFTRNNDKHITKSQITAQQPRADNQNSLRTCKQHWTGKDINTNKHNKALKQTNAPTLHPNTLRKQHRTYSKEPYHNHHRHLASWSEDGYDIRDPNIDYDPDQKKKTYTSLRLYYDGKKQKGILSLLKKIFWKCVHFEKNKIYYNTKQSYEDFYQEWSKIIEIGYKQRGKKKKAILFVTFNKNYTRKCRYVILKTFSHIIRCNGGNKNWHWASKEIIVGKDIS